MEQLLNGWEIIEDTKAHRRVRPQYTKDIFDHCAFLQHLPMQIPGSRLHDFCAVEMKSILEQYKSN